MHDTVHIIVRQFSVILINCTVLNLKWSSARFIWIGHNFEGQVYSTIMDSEKIGYIEDTEVTLKFTCYYNPKK